LEDKLKTCPFCESEYAEKNDGKGIYNECIRCNSRVYNFPLLKRSGFHRQIFTKLLVDAKQDLSSLHGNCISCNKQYRNVKYELNGYQTTVCVCPTCMEFAIQKRDLTIFELPKVESIIPDATERKYSPETEKLLAEMDTKLKADTTKWNAFDKSVKFSKSRQVGFFVFVFVLIMIFVKWGFRNASTTGFGTFVFILVFLLFLFAGFFFILGRKNIITKVKQYLSNSNDI
jgi:lipopolysaccharide export LptBFGC system permease protein LptF